MLRIFVICLFTVQPFLVKNYNIYPNTSSASQLDIVPQKKPSNFVKYEESLNSIHDIIEKEGGKKTGVIKITKI